MIEFADPLADWSSRKRLRIKPTQLVFHGAPYPKMDSTFVSQALERRLNKRPMPDPSKPSYQQNLPTCWTTFRELGYNGITADLWAISTWLNHGWHRPQRRDPLPGSKTRRVDPLIMAFEIKVSRSDFKKELENPDKRKRAMWMCHAFYFAAPLDMLHVSDIPEDCGLVEITERGAVRLTLKARRRDIDEPSWQTVATLMRRLEMRDMGLREPGGTPVQ